MKLKVFACLSEDINNGWMWIPETIVRQRTVVKIKNLNSGKTTYSESLPLGHNFLKRYNTKNRTIVIDEANSAIVLSEWYRKKLAIKNTQTTIEFKISTSENPWGHLLACLNHPQIVVRLATELGILGVALGIIGMVLALCK